MVLDKVVVDTGLTHTLRTYTAYVVQVIGHFTGVALETADLVLSRNEERLPLVSVMLLNKVKVLRLNGRRDRFKFNCRRRANAQTEKLLWRASREDICLCNLHLSYQSQNILSH